MNSRTTQADGTFTRYFEPLVPGKNRLLCTAHTARDKGQQCMWRAWSTSPQMILLAERVHEMNCHKVCSATRAP